MLNSDEVGSDYYIVWLLILLNIYTLFKSTSIAYFVQSNEKWMLNKNIPGTGYNKAWVDLSGTRTDSYAIYPYHKGFLLTNR